MLYDFACDSALSRLTHSGRIQEFLKREGGGGGGGGTNNEKRGNVPLPHQARTLFDAVRSKCN